MKGWNDGLGGNTHTPNQSWLWFFEMTAKESAGNDLLLFWLFETTLHANECLYPNLIQISWHLGKPNIFKSRENYPMSAQLHEASLWQALQFLYYRHWMSHKNPLQKVQQNKGDCGVGCCFCQQWSYKGMTRIGVVCTAGAAMCHRSDPSHSPSAITAQIGSDGVGGASSLARCKTCNTSHAAQL